MNQYFNDKSSLFHTEVSFDTSEEKQLSYFQELIFFKNKIISELFTIKNVEFGIVTFLPAKSLHKLITFGDQKRH